MSRLVPFVVRDPEADVLVVTTAWPSPDRPVYGTPVMRQVQSLLDRGVRCDVVYVRGYRSPAAYPVAALHVAAWALIRRPAYRLVHAHGGEAALVGSFYRRAPLLVTYLGSDLLGAPRADGTRSWTTRIRRRLIAEHARLARMTITESTEMEATLPRSVRRRNRVVPKGVSTELFHPRDRDAARRELGWPLDERVVLFAADPRVPLKRHWLAEAAVEIARTRLPDLRLRIADRIEPNAMPLLMNAADCLLHTSASEGSPNVVKEALMCNLPVIATPAGDIELLLADVVPSYVCAAKPEQLGAALVECLSHLQRSNGASVSRDLQLTTVAEALLAIYVAASRDDNKHAS